MAPADRLKIAALVALVTIVGSWSFSLMGHVSRKPAPQAITPPPAASTLLIPSATTAVITEPDLVPVEPIPVPAPQAVTALDAALARFQDERDRLDRTVWADERSAEDHEAVFVALWDRIRAAEDKNAALESLPFDEIAIGQRSAAVAMKDGIEITNPSPPGPAMDHAAWLSWLGSLRDRRLRLIECEFHLVRFEPSPAGARSTVSTVLHVVDDRGGARYIVRGPLEIHWSTERDERGRPRVHAIDASGVSLLCREAPAAFHELPQMPQLIRRGTGRLLVYDLDHDGFSDFVLPSSNRLLHNLGDGTYEARQLLAQPGLRPSTGLIADFTGDGNADLILSEVRGPAEPQTACLVLYAGNARGAFPDAGVVIAGPDISFDAPCMTAGDIDGDGDLDLFVAKYKEPYLDGQMPTPYYDANDGYASHLLVNTGLGSFDDATRLSGLSAKSHRRTSSASFIDLDDDGDLDLVEISDFSGVDVFWNDGTGVFTDVTPGVLDERAMFGRAHCFADFDHDGRIDLFVAGTTSTAAHRLAALGLGRKEYPKHDEMRPKMSAGNRLYCQRPDGSFSQPAFEDQAAQSGWSWGVAAIDFDNDGDCDLAIANGNISGPTALDYDPTYWCHDAYTGSSRSDPLLDLCFRKKRAEKISWSGFEHNALFMNTAGTGFVDVGFLMGTSIEQDCRALIVDDLDMDGHPDLIVEEDSSKDSVRIPAPNEMTGRYRILRNDWTSPAHWIGVRLREEGHGLSPIGATITVRTSVRTMIQKAVTGDAFYAQHANAFHFGLGMNTRVDAITVRWRNGHEQTVLNPAIDRYHDVRP